MYIPLLASFWTISWSSWSTVSIHCAACLLSQGKEQTYIPNGRFLIDLGLKILEDAVVDHLVWLSWWWKVLV